MKSKIAAMGLALLASAFGACGGPAGSAEAPRATAAPIQGGVSDTVQSFVVALVENSRSTMALCSGSLLGPNLVATARHCVAALSSTTIDCATSSFGATVPVGQLVVTTDASLDSARALYGIDTILVPEGPNQSGVCGNDIALLILSKSIALPQYVTPVTTPPMTDHSAYSSTIAAIGYGVDSPLDTMGGSAGVRRIRENIDLACIPNDKNFVDCFSDPSAMQFLSANEFESVGDACEGDSGSGAFEQRSFNSGKWLSFGVLSRGNNDVDAQTCGPDVYTRFDAWSQFLIDGAKTAASRGGYALPAWAGVPSADASGAFDAASIPASPSCGANAEACTGADDCCSAHCLSNDNGITFVCAPCGASSPCETGSACMNGKCILTALSVSDGGHEADPSDSGCGVARSRSGPGWPRAWVSALALACIGAFRRGAFRRRAFRRGAFRRRAFRRPAFKQRCGF